MIHDVTYKMIDRHIQKVINKFKKLYPLSEDASFIHSDSYYQSHQNLDWKSVYSEYNALIDASESANTSGCSKSCRGVVIFNRKTGLYSFGKNFPIFANCFNDKECKKICGKACFHAESDAINKLIYSTKYINDYILKDNAFDEQPLELLHIKIKRNKVRNTILTSGFPSCVDCAKLIMQNHIKYIWLLQTNGLRCYTAQEFLFLSLKNTNNLHSSVKLEDCL